ncbi:MAG: DNA repair protein RecO, partial [Beijerinckiaceae bacterium]
NYTVEAEAHRAAALIGSAGALYAIGYLSSLVRLLPERYSQHGIHAALDFIMDHLEDIGFAAPLIVRFEVEMLKALGFGLDLAACAATGATRGLVYVSPKSGRAVGSDAGAPYRDRLLPLPGFLANGGGDTPPSDVIDGFRMTAHFLERDIFAPRGLELPQQRTALVEALKALNS